MAATKWLDGVARILRAETGDLRELARIGGADPATLYIGTSLDGVDIRGQDLRGMALPGLDLRKVKRDDGTILDPEAGEPASDPPSTKPNFEEPSIEVTATVFLASSNLSRGPFIRRLDFGAQVFEAHEFSSFVYANRGANPAFVVFEPEDSDRAISAAADLRRAGIDFVSIALEKRLSAWGIADRARAAEFLAPLITILPGSRMAIGEGGAFEACDLIDVLTDQWILTDALLRQQPNWYFLRAKGTGPRRTLDAYVQLFERMMASKVMPGPVAVIEYVRPNFDEILSRDVGQRLLEAHDWFNIAPRSRRKPRFDAGVFGPMGPTTEEPKPYFSKVVSALEDLGWESALNVSGSRRMHLSSGYSELEVELEGGNGPAASVFADDDKLRGFTFERTSIALFQRASFDFIVDGLVVRNQLLVSARDLLGLSRKTASFWMLMANQLRRLARTKANLARDQYVELLIRAAFRRGAVDLADADEWSAILAGEYLHRYWRVSVTRVTGNDERTSCHVRLYNRQYRGPLSYLEAVLWVDATGVSLFEIDGAPPQLEGQLPFMS